MTEVQMPIQDIASTVRRTLDTDVVAVWVLNAEETHLQMYAVDFRASRGIAREGPIDAG